MRAYGVALDGGADITLPNKTKVDEARPSIAVLPFENMSGDAEQAYFSDGITEDLITSLSKIDGLFVIARNSTFTYKEQRKTVDEIAADLGVRYVLEGSVRKAGGRVRITAQLIDGQTGGHLWADRYDRDLTDVFAVQDEVTQQIVDALEVKLTDRDRRNLEQSGHGVDVEPTTTSCEGAISICDIPARRAFKPVRCSAKQSPSIPDTPKRTPGSRLPISRSGTNCGRAR